MDEKWYLFYEGTNVTRAYDTLKELVREFPPRSIHVDARYCKVRFVDKRYFEYVEEYTKKDILDMEW